MNQPIEQLETRILEYPGVYDPPTIHREFANGGHGQKLAIKAIDEKSALYTDIICANAAFISEVYDDRLPEVLIGMATSAIRIARDTAEELGDDVHALETEKDEKGRVILTYASRLLLRKLRPDSVTVIEDVATTSKTTAHFARRFRFRHPATHIEVANIWQRQAKLPYLDRNRVKYHSLISRELPMFKNAKACMEDPQGYCARKVDLIARQQ